jgi:hypothetical protein
VSKTSGWNQLIEDGYAVIPSAVDVDVCEEAPRQIDTLKKAHADIVRKMQASSEVILPLLTLAKSGAKRPRPFLHGRDATERYVRTLVVCP